MGVLASLVLHVGVVQLVMVGFAQRRSLLRLEAQQAQLFLFDRGFNFCFCKNK